MLHGKHNKWHQSIHFQFYSMVFARQTIKFEINNGVFIYILILISRPSHHNYMSESENEWFCQSVFFVIVRYSNKVFFFKTGICGPFNWHLYLNVAKFGHDIDTLNGQSHIRVGVFKFRMAEHKHKKYSRPVPSANWNLFTELNSQASIIFNK